MSFNTRTQGSHEDTLGQALCPRASFVPLCFIPPSCDL